MNLKNILVTGIIAAIVAVIAVAVVGGNNQPQSTVSPIDLGATGTRFPNGLTTSQLTLDAVGGVAVATSTFGTAESLTAGGCWSRNGLDTCEISGSFADGTSTLASFMNPFGATTTIVAAGIIVDTPATTSLDFYVGTSTSQFLGLGGLDCLTPSAKDATACAGGLIDEITLATTTLSGGKWFGAQGAMYSNGGPVAVSNAIVSASSTPTLVGPSDWIIVYATSTYSFNLCAADRGISSATGTGCSDGVLNSGNTFTGRYFIRLEKW